MNGSAAARTAAGGHTTESVSPSFGVVANQGVVRACESEDMGVVVFGQRGFKQAAAPSLAACGGGLTHATTARRDATNAAATSTSVPAASRWHTAPPPTARRQSQGLARANTNREPLQAAQKQADAPTQANATRPPRATPVRGAVPDSVPAGPTPYCTRSKRRQWKDHSAPLQMPPRDRPVLAVAAIGRASDGLFFCCALRAKRHAVQADKAATTSNIESMPSTAHSPWLAACSK